MTTILLLAFARKFRRKEGNWRLRRYERVDVMLREIGNAYAPIPVHLTRHWAQLTREQLDASMNGYMSNGTGMLYATYSVDFPAPFAPNNRVRCCFRGRPHTYRQRQFENPLQHRCRLP